MRGSQSGIVDTVDGIRVTVHVVPNARHDSISIEQDDTVTMRVRAPPTKGKANREILKGFSKKLDIPNSRIQIVSGLRSDQKIIEIVGIDRKTFLAALQR